MARQNSGQEAWERLLNWTRAQASSERLSAQILDSGGYKSIDPSHPLGGRDGLKDIVCIKEGQKWIAAAYFPRGQQEYKLIENKFEEDLEGIVKNSVEGLAFITNQELSLGQRKQLIDLADQGKLIEIFHLERIATILNSPTNYGIRLEFLDIEMTKEEQLSYMAVKDQIISGLTNTLISLGAKIAVINKKDEERSNIPEVYPETSYGYTLGRKSFKKCSHCGYGYKIGVLGYITSTPATITCPKCGNTEDYMGFF